jgi:hypothetical protein
MAEKRKACSSSVDSGTAVTWPLRTVA